MSTVDIDAIVQSILSDTKDNITIPQVSTQSSTDTIDRTINSIVADNGASGIFKTVDEAIQAAKIAQRKLFDTSLLCRRKMIDAIRKELEPLIDEMSKRAVEETGMGRVEDKIVKNTLAITNTPGVEDLVKASEIITGDEGMTLYEYCPYGVIGAIAPSTNPTETLICNAIGMLAAGNSIYFSSHPGAKETSKWLIKKLNQICLNTSGIDNLIVTIESPSIEAAQEMMLHPDIALLVVTGGPGVVLQAMQSGKKVIGAGAGNPPTIVDETANIEKAGKDIVDGASLDNNIPCIAEKNIIAVESIAEFLIFNMEKNGAYYINDINDIKKLEALLLTEKGGPNKAYVGKSATTILNDAGVKYTGNPRLIVVEGTPDMPFAVEEMLMPVIPINRTPDFDTALDLALELEHGLHHTATIHSQNVSRLNKAAKEMQTSIFVKNGPSYMGIGYGKESPTTFTIATPTGEGTTTARHFARTRRCVLTDAFSIK